MSFFTKHKITSLILVNALLLLALFIILEIFIRLAFSEQIPLGNETRKFWQYDSLLGWSHIPLVTGSQTISGASVEIKTNSKKLRGDEFEYARNAKTRILILGDSFAWGFGVNKNKRFSEIIESKNNNLELINAAVAGYSTDQQLIYYINEGYKYEPDYVLLLFCENDFLGNTLSQIHWYNKPFYRYENAKLTLKGIAVPRQSSYQKLRKILSGSSYLISFILKRITTLNAKSYSIKNFSFSDAAILTEGIIKQLNDACRTNKAQLLLVGIPMPREETDLLSSVARKYSFGFLDLSLYFKNEKDYVLLNDGHWNSKGHAIAGEAIYDWLKKIGIVE